MKINILDIVEGTTVDGPGLRTSIYMAGCHHCCPGCHNPESWASDGGTAMDLEEILSVVKENDFNVTLSGGDPLYHPTETLELCRQIKQRFGKTIWCYTGFTWEQIVASPTLRPLLDYLDVVVDGPSSSKTSSSDCVSKAAPTNASSPSAPPSPPAKSPNGKDYKTICSSNDIYSINSFLKLIFRQFH